MAPRWSAARSWWNSSREAARPFPFRRLHRAPFSGAHASAHRDRYRSSELQMLPVDRHTQQPDSSFDGGDLDCGSGLLLLIRRHIDPLQRGGLLEILSTDSTVEVELPAWWPVDRQRVGFPGPERRDNAVFWCARGPCRSAEPRRLSPPRFGFGSICGSPVSIPASLPGPAAAPKIAPLSVMGIGSWPRPRWMLQAVHDHLEGRLGDAEFHATADDAVRLSIDAQLRAGVDVLTDGEQRRDSYASFVGGLLGQLSTHSTERSDHDGGRSGKVRI